MKLTSKETLRALMDQREFSCERLGQYAGCSKSFIGFLTNGDKTSCTKELATEIARALDVPLSILFVEHTSAASGRSTSTQRKKVAA